MNPIIFFIDSFLAGILSFFSPVSSLLPVYIGILLGSDQERLFYCSGKKFADMAYLKPFVYCRYFCYFPPHWFWAGFSRKDHVQLVSVPDGSPHHYPFKRSSSDGLSLSFP